jgi:hypothetical protein
MNIDEIESFFDELDMYFDSDLNEVIYTGAIIPFFIEPYNPYAKKTREQLMREKIEMEELMARLTKCPTMMPIVI